MLPNSQIALILKTSSQLMTQNEDPSLKMIHNIAFMSLVENGCKTEDNGKFIIINIERDTFKLPYDYVCSYIGEDEYVALKTQVKTDDLNYDRTPEIVQPYRDILTGVMQLTEAIDFLETEAAKINEEQPQDSVREKMKELKEENNYLTEKINELNGKISSLETKLANQEQQFKAEKNEWVSEIEALRKSHADAEQQLTQKYQETIDQISKQYTDRENKLLNKHAAELDKLRMQLLKGQKLGLKSTPVIVEKATASSVVISDYTEPLNNRIETEELQSSDTKSIVSDKPVTQIKEEESTHTELIEEVNTEELELDTKYLFPTEDKIYRLSMDELTFNLSNVEIRDAYGNKVDSCVIITFPMSLKYKTPKVCTCLIRNQEIFVRASTPEYASVKQKCGNYPVFIQGSMDGATFKCLIDLGNASKKQGYVLNIISSKDFGQGGHLYLPDGAYHVHILPVTSRNNELNQADYIYAIEDEKGNIIECGDNSYGDGTVEVNLPSGVKRINCRWQDNVLYGDLAAKL